MSGSPDPWGAPPAGAAIGRSRHARRDPLAGCASDGHHLLTCILPPHVLHSLAINGPSARLRALAIATLSASQSLLTARVGLSALGSAGPRGIPRPVYAGLTGVPHKQRTIYDAQNRQRIPGTVVRTEAQPATGDLAVDEAYDFMGDTFDFYWNEFDRDSVDDAGLPLDGTVHFSQDYDNAFWDGQRMIYGDGDGEIFDRFTKSVDVIGHELTHGVTQYEAGLVYFGQPGALNESMSDVMGSLVRQYVNHQTAAQADWLIGAELFIPDPNFPNRLAIRSMKAPGTAYDDPVLGKDPQPATMAGYVRTLDDNAGVHINSGIPNHAFYLLATALGGNSWERAGLIWYQTLLNPLLTRAASFRSFARITLMVAEQLFPAVGAPEPPAVRQAWSQVGIQV
jgi:Zn-dependent metalloprotease